MSKQAERWRSRASSVDPAVQPLDDAVMEGLLEQAMRFIREGGRVKVGIHLPALADQDEIALMWLNEDRLEWAFFSSFSRSFPSNPHPLLDFGAKRSKGYLADRAGEFKSIDSWEWSEMCSTSHDRRAVARRLLHTLEVGYGLGVGDHVEVFIEGPGVHKQYYFAFRASGFRTPEEEIELLRAACASGPYEELFAKFNLRHSASLQSYALALRASDDGGPVDAPATLMRELAPFIELIAARGIRVSGDAVIALLIAEAWTSVVEVVKTRVGYVEGMTLEQAATAFVSTFADKHSGYERAFYDFAEASHLASSESAVADALRQAIAAQELLIYERKLDRNEPLLDADRLDALDGEAFEELLAELYRAMGFKVHLTNRGPDQGADLVLIRANSRRIVQAKRSSRPVGNAAVQEAVAAKGFYGADSAVVVTTSTFTAAARALAAANAIQLVGRAELLELMDTHGIYP